jgi:glycoside hydrolase-like protein
VASSAPLARLSTTAAFTGLGFDACTAPSARTMSAWASSPYRAVGVYIGGLNRACSQPNLTSSWVGAQVAAGWHLIPTYVGLQAPTSSCSSCAKLSSSAATSQGSAAATDAVNQARAVGIGPGSPIYFDMESYLRTSSATNATLTFLAAWTTGLHALGYESGVYSSSASGIADLAARYGTGYPSPDDLWIANWNGQQSTADPYVPANAWSQHQRIHQYRGGHDETYGGVTINIDNNYVEGATVGPSSSDDGLKGKFESAASLRPGQVRVTGWAFDPSAPTTPVSIRAYVGGKPGKPGAELYELGPVAVQPRADIGLAHRAAGSNRGFDASFIVVKSRRQRVCVYAVNVVSGADKPLGCRTVGIAVPLTLSHLKASRRGLRLRLRCEWPAGTECPGQILLRARVRVPTRTRHRRGPKTKVVTRGIARRGFRLTGERSHAFRIGLSRRGHQLTRGRTKLRAQLIVAIPGGRVTHALTLRLRG